MRIYDIISSGDFEQDLDNMFDLLSYFRKIISAKESHLKFVKDLGTKYKDEELYTSTKYSIENLQSIMQRELNAINDLGRALTDHLDLFHDWD